MFKILFAALLIASTVSVSKGQCKARVSLAEIDSGGQSGTDRMKIAQIEVDTPTTAYVRLRMCPPGTAVPSHMVLACSGSGCGGTADLSWFGTNINNYYSGGNINGQQGDPSNGCCPNGQFLWQYENHYFKACAGMLTYNGALGFPPGASTPQQTVLGNLTTYKDAWSTYGNINNGFGNIPQMNIGGCTNHQQVTYNFPPFVEDRSSMFFTHIGVSGGGEAGPGNERLNANQKYSPFIDVESKKDANGNCATYVVLGNNPSMEQAQLVSIDGVAFSCMAQSWTTTPTEFLAQDVIVSLLALTNAAPKGNEIIKIGVIYKGESDTTVVDVPIKYSYWRQLNAKLMAKTMEMQSGQQQFACWRSDQQQSFQHGPPGSGGAVEQQCSRTGVTRSENSEKAIALASMSDKLFPFIGFISSRNIETGQSGSSPSTPNPAPWRLGTCTVNISNLLDVNGNPICQANVPIIEEKPICDYEKMDTVVDDMSAFLASVKAGEAASDWQVIMQYQGKDTWAGCASIVSGSLIDGYKSISIDTDKCTTNFPDMGNSNPDSYCAENPSNAWCKDPCCYETLQESMCCRVSTKTFQRYNPSVDKTKLGENCPFGAAANIPVAIDSAMAYTNILNSPDICFAKKSTFDAEMVTLGAMPDCCYKSVVGDYDASTGQYKTNQKCATDDDCFSGSCNVGTSSSDDTSSSTCFTTEEESGKTYNCNPAEGNYVSTALAKCILDRLADQPKSIAYIKDQFANGNQSASAEQLGAGFASSTQSGTCRGESGHKYDPRNGCQDYNTTSKECKRICDGPSDCQTKCLQDTTCNWKPYDWSNFQGGHPKKTTAQECLSPDLTPAFCAGKQPWGGIEDITQVGKCSPTVGPVVKFCYGANQCSNQAKYESPLITQAFCDSISSNNYNLTRVSMGNDQFYNYSGGNWVGQNQYRCDDLEKTASKSACLNSCLDGYKPSRRYECYVKPDSTTGNCPSGSFFSRMEEDYNVELPHGVARPRFCKWSAMWGHESIREQYGYPWEANTDAAREAWTYRLNGANYTLYTHEGREAWKEFAGYEMGDGLVFNSAAKAQQVCGDPYFNALHYLADDGSEQCENDFCYHPSKITTSLCHDGTFQTTVNNVNGLQYPHFVPAFNDSNGICSIGFDQSYYDGGNYQTWYTPTNSNARKSACESIGGTFVRGVKFAAGKMDSEAKCTGSYCNVAGPRYFITPAQCTDIGGRCRKTRGCKGCERDHSNNQAKNGVCYSLVDGAANCTGSSVQYAAATNGNVCIDTSVTWRESCTGSNTWVECNGLAPKSCGNNGTGYEKILSDYTKCRSVLEPRFCKTKTECESNGECHGPSLQQQICTHNGCEIVDNVCLTAQVNHQCVDPSTCSQADGMQCMGNWNDQNGPNGQGQGCSSYCWDQKNHHFGRTTCANYRLNVSECANVGGTWTSTKMTQSKCESNQFCQGGKSNRGVHNRNASECIACGGSSVPEGTWQPAEWVVPAMVSGDQQWVQRKMQASNQWINQIDRWRFKDAVRSIQDSRQETFDSTFTECVYGNQASFLKKVAAICGYNKPADASAILSEPETVASSTTFPGVVEEVGTERGSVTIQANSVDSKISINLVSSSVERNQDGTRRRIRRLSTTNATLNDASCYSNVKNTNGKLVGQTLGNCLELQIVGSGSLSNPVEMCLEINADIEQSSDYTEYAFSKRTGSVGSYQYAPQSFSVTDKGTHLCGMISDVNTFYCPSKLVSGWATKTIDTGSSQCGALIAVVQEVEQIQQATIAANNLTVEMFNAVSSPSPATTISTSPSPATTTSTSPSPASSGSETSTNTTEISTSPSPASSGSETPTNTTEDTTEFLDTGTVSAKSNSFIFVIIALCISYFV